jgi:hypothetical protein
MAVGQRQRLYSGVRMLTGNYDISVPFPGHFAHEGLNLNKVHWFWYRYSIICQQALPVSLPVIFYGTVFMCVLGKFS